MRKEGFEMESLAKQFYMERAERTREIRRNKRWGFDFENTADFIMDMTNLTPQSYGCRLESYLIEKTQSEKVSSSLDRGDALKSGKYIEIKSSIITEWNECLNFVQIRLYQDVDYYLGYAFDIRDPENPEEYIFLLNKEQMKSEIKKTNASFAHGTKSMNEKNVNSEYRFSLNISDKDENFKRWKKLYRISSLEEISV